MTKDCQLVYSGGNEINIDEGDGAEEEGLWSIVGYLRHKSGSVLWMIHVVLSDAILLTAIARYERC